MTIAPVDPRPLASAMVTSEARSTKTISTMPTSARPPARGHAGGNFHIGRSRRCSRQVGTTPAITRAAMPSVVPTDRTSWADSGSSDSGSPLPSGTNARHAAMTTRLDRAGPRVGPANLRYDCSSPYSTTESPYSSACGANTTSM